jgi:Zn-dependent protease
MNGYSEVMRLRHVRVYVHWSVIALSGLFLLGALKRPWQVLVALISYYGVLLLHECGHMVLAQKKGCRVNWIKLYPIFGLVSFDEPYSKYDHAVIAWGGIVAQCMVAFPIALYLSLFGYTRSEVINVALGIWSYMSLSLVIFNLIPVPPLDGAMAWKLFPEMYYRFRRRSKRQTDNRDPYRFRGY